MSRWLRFPLPAFLCVAILPAAAVEPPPASQLRTDCRALVASPETPLARRCVAYIQGFVDGAVVTNARIVQDVSREYGAGETYSQRAKRTRLRERDRLNPSWYAGICIPDSVTIGEVAKSVAAYLEATPPALHENSATALYAALRAGYPCGPAGG